MRLLIKKYFFLVLFPLILLLAFLLRANLYVHHDFNFFLDQARDMMLVKQIAFDHKMTLIGARSGLGGIFHGPLWLYMIAPFFVIAQGDPFWTLVPLFLLVSLGIVAAGFFIGKSLYDSWTGLLFSLLLAMSPPLLEANLITTNAQVMPLIFLLYLFFVIKFLRGSEKYFIPAIIAIGLGFHFESAFAIFLIPLTVLLLIIRRSLPKMKTVVISFVGFFLAVSNFLFFEIRHQFLMTHAVLTLFAGKVQPLKGYENYANFGFRTMDRISLLRQYFFESIFQPNIFIYIFIICLVVAAGIVLFWKKKRSRDLIEQRKEFLFIFLIPFLYFGIYLFYPLPLWGHYILPLSITSALLLAVSLRQVTDFLLGKICIALFLILITIPVLTGIKNTYLTSQAYIPAIDGSYRNQLAAVQKVFVDAKGSSFGYFEYSTAILTYNMDYLMWWQGREHKYLPPSQKFPTTYLIMYPQPASDLHAQEFWKKNVIKTRGKMLQRWVMQGGITIEKLQISEGEQPVDPNYYQNLLFR
jgi:4-amino-4-deoxy-L-arabinose transferase-like glycosyltransferase